MIKHNDTKGKKSEMPFVLPFKIKLFIYAAWVAVKILEFFGRIKVRGIENLHSTQWENRLILSNHPSMLDPILIPLIGFMPLMIHNIENRFPRQTPNGGFESNPHFSFLKRLPIIFLKTDERGKPNDAVALRKIIRELKKSTFIIFPEGTRSFHSDEPRVKTPSGVTIGQARGGIGFLIWHAHPTVIPVLVKGADRAMPPHKSPWFALWHLWFHRVEIILGEPLDLSNVRQNGEKPTTQKFEEIGKTVMASIAALDDKKTKGGLR